MTKLTPKREKFCQELVKGCSQFESYKKAFRTKHMQDKTIREAACRLVANSNISARLAELRAPMIEECTISQQDWLRKMMGYFHADVRKMFDEFGNPVEIAKLGDNEALMVEGFEFNEDYTTVKKGGGQELAVPTGYTKKVKLTSKLKAMMEFGKVMGWYEDPDKKNTNNHPQRIFIRQWITQEEQHVHVHAGNGGASNGADHDRGGSVGNGGGAVGVPVVRADERPVASGTAMAAESPDGSGPNRSDECASIPGADARGAELCQRDESRAAPEADAENWRQVLLHEQPRRSD